MTALLNLKLDRVEQKHQSFTFHKNIEHYITANENSKFLIIR